MASPEDTKPASSFWNPRVMDSRRALILMALGALVGLGVAGFALFTAKGTTTLAVPADAVAMVNQQPISRVDYLAQLQALYSVDLAHATPEQRQRVLNDMIREELFVQRGKELDVPNFDPDVRNAMVSAVEQQAAYNAVTNKPKDSQLQAFYEQHKARFSSEGTMELKEAVFPAATAAAAVRAMAGGLGIDEAIARFGGRAPKRTDGEEFYFAARIHLGDAVFDSACGLADGQLSAPVAQPDGVHVVKMIHNVPPKPMDFAEARERVLSEYTADAVKRLQTGDATFLRKRANILIARDMH